MGSFVFTAVNYRIIEICPRICSFYPYSLIAVMIAGAWIASKFYRRVTKLTKLSASGLRFCFVSLIYFFSL